MSGSRRGVRSQNPLQRGRSNLVEISVEYARIQERRLTDEFEKFDVIVAAECRMNCNAELDGRRFPHYNVPLLGLPDQQVTVETQYSTKNRSLKTIAKNCKVI